MSDAVHHECGIAMVRLRKPLNHYVEKYGTALYGLNKMYLLMEKQHNRGQDGAGLANIKLDMPPGQRYISRRRSVKDNPIHDIFQKVQKRILEGVGSHPERLQDVEWLKNNLPFTGEVFLGHLRYGTYGGNSVEACHPFLRQNNWMTRNLILAGNFNMTNVDELFNQLVDLGQHPKEKADTVTVLEKIGHFLDEANEELYGRFREEGYSKVEISHQIAQHLDVAAILRQAAKKWDGGYSMVGLIGHGDSFVLRDPSGIRPAFYYMDDEVVVVASERPVIQTGFNVPLEEIKEVPPGNALIIKKNGKVFLEVVREPLEKRSCSFERIYFSRGNDKDIYSERLQLGRNLAPVILNKVNHDIDNTVFSFIPNTAEVSYLGLIKGAEDILNEWKVKELVKLNGANDEAAVSDIINKHIRIDKVTWKDVKLRTFITADSSRDDLVAHVYDITYGTVRKTDTLVVMDDSIVRGTTLKQSILQILDRLNPKEIIVVSSAPQIRYPDCYGIDMARMEDFIAFRAAIALLKESGRENIIRETYQKCLAQTELPDEEVRNFVRDIYAPFTPEELSEKMAELLRPKGIRAKVQLVFQTIENLHIACPGSRGDWYFTGDYPTPGGNRVVNRAFIYYMEGRKERPY